MNRFRTDNMLAAGYLLLALLLAQAGAIAHAWQHEPGSAQSKACAACASASQLASACVDNVQFARLQPMLSGPIAHHAARSRSTETVAFRSRGPPSTL